MKNKHLLLLPYLGFLAISSLLGQNSFNDTEPYDAEYCITSPMMMFRRGAKEEAKKASDLTITEHDDQRMRTGGDNAASQAARGSAAVAMAETDKVTEEDVTEFLKSEICNNIYIACLAEVADWSLAERGTAEGISRERAEWEAAQEMANEKEEECKRAWEEAKKETVKAKEKSSSATAVVHGKSYADEAYYNFQIKELAEKLAAARLQTAHATTIAIRVKDSKQRAGAEGNLEAALTKERAASDALKEATTNKQEQKAAFDPTKKETENVIKIDPNTWNAARVAHAIDEWGDSLEYKAIVQQEAKEKADRAKAAKKAWSTTTNALNIKREEQKIATEIEVAKKKWAAKSDNKSTIQQETTKMEEQYFDNSCSGRAARKEWEKSPAARVQLTTRMNEDAIQQCWENSPEGKTFIARQVAIDRAGRAAEAIAEAEREAEEKFIASGVKTTSKEFFETKMQTDVWSVIIDEKKTFNSYMAAHDAWDAELAAREEEAARIAKDKNNNKIKFEAAARNIEFMDLNIAAIKEDEDRATKAKSAYHEAVKAVGVRKNQLIENNSTCLIN